MRAEIPSSGTAFPEMITLSQLPDLTTYVISEQIRKPKWRQAPHGQGTANTVPEGDE
jgi:hypothetical protein